MVSTSSVNIHRGCIGSRRTQVVCPEDETLSGGRQLKQYPIEALDWHVM